MLNSFHLNHFILRLSLMFSLLIEPSSALMTMSQTSQKMKAVVASKLGDPMNVLRIEDSVDQPLADDKHVIIKVHACSLSPGDYRALLGEKKLVANTWPYIPGGDVCGTVESVPKGFEKEFQVGDKVVATWDVYGKGGLAQYHKVNPKITVKLPSELSVEEGAALANSASHALQILHRANIQEGDRVLVLGGSGGVGTVLVQLLKTVKGASFVAATSTDETLMKDLGVDKCLNYTQENLWDIKEFHENQFDCIIDLAVGKEAWDACRPLIKTCRQGGRFVAAVYHQWKINIAKVHHLFGFLGLPFLRQLWNVFRRSPPYYRMYLGEPTKQTISEVLDMAAMKEFKTVLDPESPYPFTNEGVHKAWNKLIARKGHGKIVINVE
jgi:NADPH:quinone reductase-like Zn-dependent oxidoreductase